MRAAILALTTAVGVPQVLPAQIRASERSTLTQTIDGTVITLDYARPLVKGRSPVYGKVIHWNEVWTPGANWATTLEASKPVELDGHAVPKGKYSVWLIVRQAGPWTMVLDPDHRRFHMNPPDSAATQIRFPVTPVPGPRTEVLTWSFPEIRVNGGKLGLQWADTTVTMDLKVSPSYGITMSESAAAPYAGRYTFVWLPIPGQKGDTTELVLSWEKGSLWGEFVPTDNYMGRFVMIPLADGSLIPGLFEKGEIYEVIRDMVFEFKGPKGRPDRFDIRDDDDEVFATGKRKAGG